MATAPEQPLVPISKRLVLINSISGVITRILTVGVFAWVIQYLMRRIPEEELALLPIMGSIALALPLLQSLLTGGLARHITASYAQNDMDGVRRIVSSQFPLLIGGSLLIILLGSLMTWKLNHLLNIAPSLVDSARFMSLLLVGRIAIGVAIAPFSTGLFARQKFIVLNLIDILSSLLRIAIMLTLILGVGPKVEWIILSQVASQLFNQLTATAISLKLIPALRFRWKSFDWKTCKIVLSFSTWSFIADSANIIRRSADAPILNIFSTPTAVIAFYLGSLFETQLRQLVITATQPLLPALTAMHATDQHHRLAAAYLRGGRLALWISLFLSVPLMVFAGDLFYLYLGDELVVYAEAPIVMKMLLLGFPLTYPSMMYLRICQAKGDIRPFAIRSITVQLLNLMLTLSLVGYFGLGAVGSATATLFAFVVGYPYLFWSTAIHALGLTWQRFISDTLVPGLLPGFVSTCVGSLFFCLDLPILSRVIFGISMCQIAYLATLARVLKPVDRADIGRMISWART